MTRQAPVTYDVTAVVIDEKQNASIRCRTFEGYTVKLHDAGALVVTQVGKRHPSVILNANVWRTVERVEDRVEPKAEPDLAAVDAALGNEPFVPVPVPPSALDVALPETDADWTGQSELADGRELPPAEAAPVMLDEGTDGHESPIVREVIDETEATGLKAGGTVKLIRKEPDPRAALHTPATGQARGRWGSRFTPAKKEPEGG